MREEERGNRKVLNLGLGAHAGGQVLDGTGMRRRRRRRSLIRTKSSIDKK